MKRIFLYFFTLSLLCLTSCYNQSNNIEEKHTLLIQALPESAALITVIESLSEGINDIVKKEIGLDKNFDFNFFTPKAILRLTLYYINDVAKSNDQLILSYLDTISFNSINFVSIAPKVEFFQGSFDEKDELVVMINDQDHELLNLHNEIKDVMHDANEAYKKRHFHYLYDQEKSEQFDYVPHIGLGRIRAASIKSHLKDSSQFADVFAHIQRKVKILVEDYIKNIVNKNNDILVINEIGVFDIDNKVYLKEYLIK